MYQLIFFFFFFFVKGDAMQLYRGFDIATNKASAAECE
jgi:tRNA A37 N6-isopentenylltransferase MiaA